MPDFESIYHDEGFSDWDDYESWVEHGRVPASVYRAQHNMEGLDYWKDREELRQWEESENNRWRETLSRTNPRSTRHSQVDRSSIQVPCCPRCGKAMVMRSAIQGFNAGNHFWGCSSFPNCRGTRCLTDKEK